MKSKKGQEETGLGTIMVLFIAILIGVIFVQTIAQSVGSSTSTVAVDENITAPANGGVYNFTNYRALSGLTITNATGGEVITAGNYTIANNQILNGELVVTLTVDDAKYQSSSWNIVGTGQPTTYIADGGARSMANLIVIMFALAVAVVALLPILNNKIFGD